MKSSKTSEQVFKSAGNVFINVALIVLLSMGSTSLFGQVSGTVFRDFNSNGSRENTSGTFVEPVVQGVTVKAYSSAGVEVGSTTTGTNGTYSFTGLTLPLRIEFSNFQNEDYTGPAGSSNASSVQFYTASTTTANFAVNYPANYCQSNPSYVVTKYKNVAVPSSVSLVKAPYTSTGNNNPAIETYLADKSEVGIIYGTAYDRANQMIYASAFIKRHSGSTKDSDADGKEDIGMIYSINSSGTATNWLNLTTLGVDVGLSNMPTIAQRGLNTSNVSDWSYDDLIFSQVGKIGLGDMDISDDNKTLYIVNLFDKKLYSIDIATKTLVGGAGVSIPSSCTGGSMRPFAVKYYRGNVYVGVVCDAASSQLTADLNATIYRFDGSSFTSVLSFPLNYAKGPAFIDGPPGGPKYGTSWRPWTDDQTFATQFAFTASNGNPAIVYCQPILADIEFDYNSDMILSFIDRLGHQSGANNLRPDPAHTSTTLYTNVAGGDLLRASFSTGTYVLESNGTCGGVTTSGAGNNQGPGGGEFYVGDESLMYHQETVTGGAMIFPGKQEIAVPVVDPLNFWAEGPRWFSNNTGLQLRSYEIRPTTGAFSVEDGGKANSLGDLEMLCNDAPLEIGNRVWNDSDSDGIQDAGESGIANVTMELYADFDNDGNPDGAALASTNTASDGTWYFNASNVTDGDPGTSGNQAGPQPEKRYLIRVGNADWSGGVGVAQLSNLFLTTSNVGGAGQPDVRDNDATLSSSIPTISYLTGKSGQNDHTLDMGFKVASCALTSAGETLETCNNNGTPSNAADDYITFSLNPTGTTLGATYSVTADNGGTVTLAGGGAATAVAYGSATAFRLQTGSANNTLYTITVTDVGGAPCTATTTVQQMSCSSTCALTSAGETLETCNNNGTSSDPADDYITFSLNPTGLNLGATYSVTANNGGTVTLAGGGAATAVAYGSATAFRLQTGSANNTLYTITVTDVGGAPCTATTTVQQTSCSPDCSLTSQGKTFETCNNNGTPSNPADDYITFSLNPTGTNLGATYSVTANNGGTVTLAGGGAATAVAYGSATAFRLQTGSANNTLYTITVTDASGAPCTATSIAQQMSCSSNCSLSNLTEGNRSSCNNNGTTGPGNDGDDWVTADITLEFSNRPATGNLVLTGDVLPGGGALSVPVGSLGAGPTYTFVGVRLVADGTPITVTATFDAAPSCTVTNSTLPSAPRCSNCPDIPCGDTDFVRN